ncbi:MAG TPA: hypothetical protein VJP40_08460 [bacterium]|nr:hypothetical protein [bacterium]
MRKSSIIYFIWAVGTIGAIYAIIQYGNRLQAPAALPKHWAIQGAPLCPLFPRNESVMLLKQSGETLDIAFLPAPHLGLHGKIKRDGSFRFAGEARGLAALGCRKGKFFWEGKAGRDFIDGVFKVEGDNCAVCPEPIQISGRPHAPK